MPFTIDYYQRDNVSLLENAEWHKKIYSIIKLLN